MAGKGAKLKNNAWLFTITDEYLQKYSQPIIADELWILPLMNGKHVVWLDDTTGKCCHACGECHPDCGDYTILTPGEFSDMLRRLSLEYPGHLYFTAFKKTINKITINIDWRK